MKYKDNVDEDQIQVKVVGMKQNGDESPPPNYETATSNGTPVTKDGKTESKDIKDDTSEIGYFGIFRFATGKDYFYILIGTISAIIHGASLPVMFIFFGDMTNSFVSYGKYEPCAFNYTLCVQQGVIDPNVTTFFEFVQELEEYGTELNSEMARYSLYYVYLAIIILVFASIQVYFWMLQAVRQVRQIRIKFFQSILRQDIGFFDLNSVGELNTRLADDIQKIQDGISDKVSISIQMFARALAGLVIGFIYSWKLALVILAVSPLLGISAAMLFKIATAFTKKELQAYAQAGAVAEEVISSIRTVVAFGGEEKECERYDENLIPAKETGIRKGTISGSGIGVVMFILFSTYGLAFWYCSTLIFDGELSTGNMLTCFFGVLIGAFALGQSGSNMEYFSAATAAAGKIFEIIDREPPIDSFSTEGHKPQQVSGQIEFKNVDFTYPSRPDVQVLKGISFKAEVGKTIALCGQSGCGKSTCVQLIQRFYDPQNGVIEFDGHDIRTLNTRWLRENIGVVSQEPILFDTTIRENIKYGRDGVTDQEVEEAAKQANAYDFIMKLPNKFETLVGEGGAQMSGGQKQRIAIARAIVRNPKIMLLDEATSALDTESESIVQAALEKASQGRTTIVIAHRLSTIRNSDVIIGFSDGKVMEQGSHNELLKLEDGVYQNLVHMQTYGTEDVEKKEEKETAEIDNLPLQDEIKSAPKRRSTKRKRVLSESSTKSGGKDEEVVMDEEEEEEDLPEVPFSRVVALNKPELGFIISGCFAAAVNGGIQPCFAILFSGILGIFGEPDNIDHQKDQVRLYALLFVAIGAAAFIANLIQAASFAKSGEELTSRLRSRGFRAMLRQDIAYFDDHRNSTGALTTRLATDASRVQGCTGVRAGTVIQNICALGVALGIAFAYGWQLTLITLCFVPFMIIAGFIMMRLLTGKSGTESKAYEKAGSIATEATLNIRTVASLTKEQYMFDKYKEALVFPFSKSQQKALFYGVSFGFSQCIVFFAYAATFRYGAYLVEEGVMSFDNVYKVLMAVIFGAFAVGQTSSFAPDYAQAKISTNRLFKLLDRVPEIDSYSPEGETPESSRGKTAIYNAKFNYPTRPDFLVLKGLSVAVEPGQTIALVGQSGCGKSTCIQLIERFYDPTEGQVLLDDKDNKSLNISWLRRQMGIVSQEPVLFDRSIADNIRYGDNTYVASMEEVVAAAKAANIHNFIETLPDGYNTSVGDKGTQLSGGQKQRVAIARALLRNPKVLLLDEATSALDTESEKIVQDALDAARQGRTCIVIAHRLSTVKNADNIAVVENGTIVEFGKHDELLALQGSYFSLVNAQLNGAQET
uniref:ATP-dependent translocase ABCB1-like isoform X2 n=1 Tax=Styela clava TaxID=7725 RepID=UPI00193A13CA|nr:ATP-dependent translocase ABCB1-like isoform X2 [Styela clava]